MSLADRTTNGGRRGRRRGQRRSWLGSLALVASFTTIAALGRRRSPGPAVKSRRGWAAWKHILYRTYEEINNDRLLALAAGVVFYGLLALFPAITALVSSYALFATASTISNHLATISSMVPAR